MMKMMMNLESSSSTATGVATTEGATATAAGVATTVLAVDIFSREKNVDRGGVDMSDNFHYHSGNVYLLCSDDVLVFISGCLFVHNDRFATTVSSSFVDC